MSLIKTIKNFVYKSPGIRTSVSVATSVLIGIFSNTLVTEISTPAGIVWASIPHTFSFWALMASCIATYLFYRYMHIYEVEIDAFKDADYCMAYARSQLIPAQVEASKQAIASGDTDQFKAAMKQIKDVLK